jgi:chemotaxis protein MotB
MKIVLLSLLAVACVPKKDFTALQDELAANRTSLEAQVAERDARIQSLEAALRDEQAKLAGLDTQLGELDKQYQALTSEKASLLKDKSQLKASVDEMEQALKDLAERRAAAEAQVAQYKDLLARFQKLLDAGRLRVKIVDGRMVVELATDVLFASGRAELSDEGRTALLEVAKVLAEIPERHFQVEGHTDNDPIKTDKFPSNWERASARSITVVRTLVEGGLAPTRVSGASYAEFRPVADNGSAAGKASNRRIEIVVVPDLSQLPGFEELQKIGKD